MGQDTKIEWADHTFNPWEGCTKVSRGCWKCYAEARNARFGGGEAPNWGKGAPRRRTSPENWKLPLKWDRAAAAADEQHRSSFVAHGPSVAGPVPRRPRVFCASLADWLDDEVQIEWLVDLLGLIRRTPNLDWLLLTKRPQNWYRRISEAGLTANYAQNREVAEMALAWIKGDAPANVWTGTTVEDQEQFNIRVPALYQIPGVKFLSCEPLLGPIDFGIRKFNGWELHSIHGRETQWGIDWVICGGESGLSARPMRLDWARGLRDQCASINVPFLFKQWGEWFPLDQVIHRLGEEWTATGAAKIERGVAVHEWPDGTKSIDLGKKISGRLLDGIEHNAFPEVRS